LKVRARVEDEEGNMVTRLIETTTGRVIFNEYVPEDVPYVNELLTKKNLKKVISNVIERTNFTVTAKFLDDIKTMGFLWSFKGGLSFNLGDLIEPTVKATDAGRSTRRGRGGLGELQHGTDHQQRAVQPDHR
jgi:DNA-directed RNA polymerase subunit beta'